MQILFVLSFVAVVSTSGCSEAERETVSDRGYASIQPEPSPPGGDRPVESPEPTARGSGQTEEVTPTVEARPAASSEPLPPGYEVIALYQAGKIPQARAALEKWVRESAEAAAAIEVRREHELRRKLGHSLAVNLTVYCFKLDRQSRGGAPFPPQLLNIARLARETMQPIIDETKRLEAANSPLATRRATEGREYAERQLADLIPLEINALKRLGRDDEAKGLAVQYAPLLKAHGLSASGEPPITAIVLRRTWMGGAETISYYRNGSAAKSWDGPPQTGVISGKSFGSLSEKDYDELVLELSKLNYLSLKDSYRGDTHDADEHVLTISSSTGEKTIRATMAGAPARLGQFFDLIKKKAATAGWRPAGSEEERIER